ncbi:DUF695 domain-containing protein [Bradymonas sediminis]|uniref:Uncharacterized protein n=1 Tax=Bradymonas sediminis TaxID=1548548 RepID=A0A2Z4FQF6_9DELT|nr:DUF695 domain-containing protein [Bradymonas sediminis]AWV90886.1 hypothetical protein DN745_16775 [Bradymonas sediminis]TDP75378.1 regulator of ribonuclease activity B [Bradymonas sediminis]
MSFAKKTQTIETFPRRVGAADTMVGVNLSLEARAPLKNLEWVNSLRISLPGADAQDDPAGGHPQITSILHIEPGADALPDDAPRMAGSVSTARSTEWFIYSESPFAEQLQKAIGAQFPDLEVHAHAKHDPDWSVFREFLMPSPQERHLIETRQNYEGLLSRHFQENDGLTLNHTFWFTSPEDRQDFAQSLPMEDYEAHFPDVEDEDMHPFQIPGLPAPDADLEVEYGLMVSHYQRLQLDSLNDRVRDIYRRAMSFGGEYEGWYTPDDRGD